MKDKYRAWDPENEKMIYEDIAICDGIVYEICKSTRVILPLYTVIERKTWIPMQSIGVFDSKNHLIYDRDIILGDDGDYGHGLVIWEWCWWRIQHLSSDNEIIDLSNRWTKYGKVKGNKYQNPEWL